MSRKKTEERVGLEDQAEAVREDVPAPGADGGVPAEVNGEAKPKGPPRLNPPRYWLAVRGQQGELVLMRELRSLKSAVREWPGHQAVCRMFASGTPLIVKVKIAFPVPTAPEPTA